MKQLNKQVTMVRKTIGWALAIISVILLLLTIGVGVYGFSSSKVELVTTVFQSGIISIFVCTGLSILLLRKQQNGSKVSWWHKAMRVLGYIFLIIFMFSIPGMHYFDMYEILPRILLLIIICLLLRSYKKHPNNKYEKNTL